MSAKKVAKKAAGKRGRPRKVVAEIPEAPPVIEEAPPVIEEDQPQIPEAPPVIQAAHSVCTRCDRAKAERANLRKVQEYFRRYPEPPHVVKEYVAKILRGVASGKVVVQPVVGKEPMIMEAIYSPEKEEELKRTKTFIRFVWNSFLA